LHHAKWSVSMNGKRNILNIQSKNCLRDIMNETIDTQ